MYAKRAVLPYEEENMSILNEISELLQAGKRKQVAELCTQAIEQGIPAAEILNDGLMPGMDVIGEKFKEGEVFVPQVLIAARAMKAGTEVLKPYLNDGESTAKGKLCIGTVKGDLHDVGKNLVAMMMEGKGFEVIDLGVDVPPEVFVQTARDEHCDIVCCSALLTTTMPVMADIVKAFEEAGIRQDVKIMVGGAPVTDEFAAKIGADAYTPDAASAADKAIELVSEAN